MKNIITLLATILLLGMVFIALDRGLDKNEINQCNTWKEYSENYSGFYLLSWEYEQCVSHGIIINATVIK